MKIVTTRSLNSLGALADAFKNGFINPSDPNQCLSFTEQFTFNSSYIFRTTAELRAAHAIFW